MPTLTDFKIAALSDPLNLADGHATHEAFALNGAKGLLVLPGYQFFRNLPDGVRNQGFIRLAMMKPKDSFHSAIERLSEVALVTPRCYWTNLCVVVTRSNGEMCA